MHIPLLIRFHTKELVSWATFDRKKRIINSAISVPLNEVPTSNYQPLILIPSTEVILTQVNIPSKNRHKIIQAIPYALEEQLIDEVENLHFAIGQPVAGNIPVAVIARTCLENYLQRLQTAGFKPAVIIPDVLAILYQSNNWTVMYTDDIVLVRTGLQAGFAVEVDNLIFMLQLAVTNSQPEQIIVINHKTTMDLTNLQTLGFPLKIIESNILDGIIVDKQLNLLQGEYRPQNNNLLRHWWLTIALGLIWSGLYITEQIMEYRDLSQQRQILNQQITEIYRNTFPKARKIVNPRVQMEQNLVALREQQQVNEIFLSTLNKITPTLKSIPNLFIKKITFRQQKIDLYLILNNFQDLEKIQIQLDKLNIAVKIKSATSQNKRVETHIQISIKKINQQ
ncbi:MAG TPA: type II secretion system protein GspL [Thioploca sp.]|nr:type II secretion system protein GspL [Thioploca sp.]